MTRLSRWPIVIPVSIIGGFAAWFAWQRWRPLTPSTPPSPPSSAMADPLPMAPQEPASAPNAAPPNRFTIEALGDPKEASLPAPPVPSSGVENQVTEELFALLGKDSALSRFTLDGFATRVVVTVDNLARKHASTRFWPIEKTPERFTVQPLGQAGVISAANETRYAPFVRFVEAIDMRKLVQVYVRLYPRFQQAYDQLGRTGKYFNDRLVDVIDHLLATPSTGEPVKVHLTDDKRPYGSTRPWVRYEFEDSALEEKSSGQKILLRIGPSNAQRLKLKLIELRVLLTRGAVVP